MFGNKRISKRSLSLKLYIIVASSGLFITFLFSTIHFYVNYKKELRLLDERIEYLKVSYLPGLAKSLYEINEEQIELQLKGVIELQDIVKVRVFDESIPLTIEKGQPGNYSDLRVRNFPLLYSSLSGKEISIGTLSVSVSYDTLYKRTYVQFLNIILSNSLIVFSAAFIIFIATELLITRPLAKLASYTEGIAVSDASDEVAPPGRQLKTRDELSTIEGSIISLQERIAAFVTNKKEAQETLSRTLSEKEILLRELYHRTKNNMQVISSMLMLQRLNMNDPVISEVFQDMESRILSMALVHQMLYETKDLSTVKLNSYIERLVVILNETYTTDSHKVDTIVEGSEILINIDTALPCGLVINELISNSLKHAFPDKRGGTIHVRTEYLPGEFISMTISDNGIGVDECFDFRDQPSLGLQTVFNIVEHQLHGSIDFICDKGLTVKICFAETRITTRV